MFRSGQRIRIKPIQELREMMDSGNSIDGITMVDTMLVYAGMVGTIEEDCVKPVLYGFIYPERAVERVDEIWAGDWVKIKSWDKMVKEFGVDQDGDIDLGSEYFTKRMKPLCGMIAQVHRIDGDILFLGDNPVLERFVSTHDYSMTMDMVTRIKSPFEEENE